VAIENILQNSQEASDNSKIRIVVSKVTLTNPELISGQYIPVGSYGKIEVKDSGRGIDKESLFKVFDPYYSTKARGIVKGMGLGLTIVYATLRNHGGHIVVSSEEGHGTVVSLYLPVFLQTDKMSQGLPQAQQPRSILLIDPDSQMREIGTIMLTYLGFEVIAVANSSEATLKLQRQDSESKPPCLVILDISGLNQESPVDCCRIFKQLVPSLHVIAMSGTILDPIIENCQEYGFANSLSKPYSMDSLRHIVNSVLYV
jgi:CheY-like chemotaxis protein